LGEAVWLDWNAIEHKLPTKGQTTMTQAERTELAKVVRLRAKVAKDEVGHQEAVQIADVEAQLSAKYTVSDEAWADLTGQAAAVVAAADAAIAKRCLVHGHE
jgi:phage gp16-like protein